MVKIPVSYSGDGWAPKPILDVVEKRKSLSPARNQSPAVQFITHWYINWGTPTSMSKKKLENRHIYIYIIILKINIFLHVMLCSMVDVYQLSEKLAGSILNFFIYSYLYHILHAYYTLICISIEAIISSETSVTFTLLCKYINRCMFLWILL